MTNPYGQQNPYDQNPYGQNPYGQNPYGQNPYAQTPYGQPGGMPGRTEPLAIASLIVAIAGLVTCGLGGLVGAILGHMGRKKIQRDPNLTGEGLALAGIIVGWILGAGFILWLVFFGAAFVHGFSQGLNS
jgi:hypothetical protein